MDEYTYTVGPNGADFRFKYGVDVYYNGRRIGGDLASTLIGARFCARRIKRRHIKRQRIKSSTGSV